MRFSLERHSKGGIIANSGVKHTSEEYFRVWLSECHFFLWTRGENGKEVNFHWVSTQGQALCVTRHGFLLIMNWELHGIILIMKEDRFSHFTVIKSPSYSYGESGCKTKLPTEYVVALYPIVMFLLPNLRHEVSPRAACSQILLSPPHFTVWKTTIKITLKTQAGGFLRLLLKCLCYVGCLV